MDAAALCECCVVAASGGDGGPWQPLQAALKSFSLGYLLSLPGLALAALAWRVIRPRLAPGQRADAGYAALLGCVALQGLLGALVWYGVVSHRILMTTNYFHKLMYGGWSNAITAAGLIVLGASLLIAAYGWRRAQPPRRIDGADAPDEWTSEAAAYGLRHYPASGVATAALTGVLRPALLVNADYWASLDVDARALALAHERTHLTRRDNLRKLLLEGAALLYGALPGMRRWAGQYELDSELAVDDACRRLDEPAYRALVADAAQWAIGARSGDVTTSAPPQVFAPAHLHRFAPGAVSPLAADAPQSGLSQSALTERLAVLARGRQVPIAWAAPGAVTACLLLSAAPTLALLSHPVPRCLLACYLGY